jgi:hypothetical protein
MKCGGKMKEIYRVRENERKYDKGILIKKYLEPKHYRQIFYHSGSFVKFQKNNFAT